MTDVLTPEERSRCMAAVRSKHTKPEISVRGLVTSLGYRYRLHGTTLPGKPDIVFTRLRKVIFVHGCFWHHHSCPRGRIQPKTNAEFWRKKRLGNMARDRANRRVLRRKKWEYLVIWECEVKNADQLRERIVRFLNAPSISKC